MGGRLYYCGERGFVVGFWTFSLACWCQRSDIWSLLFSDYSGSSGTPRDSGLDSDFGGSDLRRHDVEWSYSKVAVGYFLGWTPVWLDSRRISGILVLKAQTDTIGKTQLNRFDAETTGWLLEY